ncbi:hypothetical protein K523DRAFT_357599 [Schizophyllum commune Tattone D]|nr:hypothetical protein K523DRAFT_357599 [Schizophyllum commune Tattone D]
MSAQPTDAECSAGYAAATTSTAEGEQGPRIVPTPLQARSTALIHAPLPVRPFPPQSLLSPNAPGDYNSAQTQHRERSKASIQAWFVYRYAKSRRSR